MALLKISDRWIAQRWKKESMHVHLLQTLCWMIQKTCRNSFKRFEFFYENYLKMLIFAQGLVKRLLRNLVDTVMSVRVAASGALR